MVLKAKRRERRRHRAQHKHGAYCNAAYGSPHHDGRVRTEPLTPLAYAAFLPRLGLCLCLCFLTFALALFFFDFGFGLTTSCPPDTGGMFPAPLNSALDKGALAKEGELGPLHSSAKQGASGAGAGKPTDSLDTCGERASYKSTS